MQFVVREVSTTDLDALWELVSQATIGMTSLQIDREQLEDRIERAHFAFRRTTERAEGAPYVFVLEDLDTAKLVGTSCIFSKTGGFEPFYAYQIRGEVHYCELLDQSREIRALHLLKIHDGPTELGGLFLLPDIRGGGIGKLLSLSRFMYMAAHPKRFAKETIAELRGFLNQEGESPFWNAIGSHFFPIDYPRADALSMIDKKFIEDLMPKYPIYLELLPEPAIAAIGNVHDQAKPAYKLLLQQGFAPRDLVDIFDGGAVVHCETASIDAIRKTVQGEVAGIENNLAGGVGVCLALVSSENPRFRCALGSVKMTEQGVMLEETLATALHVLAGDRVRILSVS